MTKFEEEFKALTSWDWINIDLIQRILTRFGNWHSDEEFQELLEQNAELIRENNIVNQINSKLESQIINLKSQLQQQALPVVPEFVAEWYEEHKDDLEHGIYSINVSLDKTAIGELTDVERWFNDVSNEPNETIFIMKRLGYQVEKPQLFEVKMPIIYWDDDASQLTTGFDFLRIDKETDEVDFVGFLSNTKKHTVHFTEQEIKSIDERYWQFAVPVEDGE